eukprot:gnl/Chilomastix_caulleri/526.p1 GENE.gnl/Chilomastix_caulleri/526~~gnl/Chilomastix_caulleri/526.p1  ORF type:complete len:83 (-),score=12.67 gnl/Chilomastix_caulleri/526:307-555(-)
MGGKFRAGKKDLYEEDEDTLVSKEVVMDYYERVKVFYQGCQKPSRDQYKRSLMVTGVGVAVLGLTGFVVKAISVPILHAIGF